MCHFMIFWLQVYNVFQVILSAYVLYEACVSGWFNGYSWSEFNFTVSSKVSSLSAVTS